ncbi:MAG TPA: MFS transporter [Chloroflexota bacterium]|nr:MFS transporter [Chloroflexota bacterium]
MREAGVFTGMRLFAMVWLGQSLSAIGSGLTSFALGLWVYQLSGSVTQFALVALCATLPRVILSPLAGPLVDRWNRRTVMILADAGGGLCVLAVALLLRIDRLEVWHIYLLTAAMGALLTFQWPAYTAATTSIVPAKQLGRANGMVQFSQAAADVLAPVVAGALMAVIQIWGVILIDVASFAVGVATLLAVRFPGVAAGSGSRERGSIAREVADGWRYTAARPGLVALLGFLALTSFIWGMVGVVLAPMVLGFGDAATLGLIISIAGSGMIVGSLFMGAWGGPSRRILGVLAFELMSGCCFLLIGVRPLAWLVAMGVFGAHFTIPIINGCSQAIWQTRVESSLQGRVFATIQMSTKAASLLAYLAAGPLADRLLTPLLLDGGGLAASAGLLVGTGPGRGIGLLLLLMGLLKVSVAVGGFLLPRLRLMEDELPATP